MSRMLTPQGRLSGLGWAMIALAAVGACAIGWSTSRKGSLGTTLMVVGGILALLVSISLLTHAVIEHTAEMRDRQDWAAFERSLEDGVRFDVPDGMGYAAELPAALEDLRDCGEPTDGAARHAIVGSHEDVHWCAFQHERPGGTSTVGMVGLHPERQADNYPRIRVTVKDPAGQRFDDCYDVMCESQELVRRVLDEHARGTLMSVEPFAWRLEGNQIVTRDERPSTPEQEVAFIEDRVLPLAQIAQRIPLDA